MNKLLTLTLAFFAAGSMAAAPLSPAEALSRVAKESPAKIAGKALKSSPVFTVMSEAQIPAAYVFTAESGRGYMILSADDVAYPMLGYSDTGVFDSDNIPESMQWVLSEYARMIEWASAKGASVSKAPQAPQGWEVVSPLCKTKWNQSAPYNDACPIDKRNSQKCVTGCVATSMAQAMKYFNYPASGAGTVTYSPQNVSGSISMNFDETTFDWQNMLDVYSWGKYSDAQALAVATLMKACGFSVMMNYGSDASGASGADIAAALRTYMKYDDNCRCEYRLIYSMSQWMEMIYNNIKNIGPVIINGNDPGEAGHSFVCDGYDGNGYFHFNWGWGGMADGYFALDALNPDSMGIGGYGSGFNFSQNAIIGIRPPVEGSQGFVPNLIQTGNLTASVSNSQLSFGTSDYSLYGYKGWFNLSGMTISGKFGIQFAPASGEGETIMVEAKQSGRDSFKLLSGSVLTSMSKIKAELPVLSDGRYKVTLMVKPEGFGWEEILVPWGYNNYVYIDKSASGLEIVMPDWSYFQIEEASITTELYNGFNVLVKTKFVNNSDKETVQGVTPRLISNSRAQFTGPNILMTIGPNQTVEKDLIFTFTPLSGSSFSDPTDYVLNFINPENNVSYGDFGTYKMSTGPKTTLMNLKELEIPGAPEVKVEYAGGARRAFEVANMSDFDVNFSYSVRAGYFDKVMKLSVFEVDPESFNTLVAIESLDGVYRATPFLEKDQVSDNVVKICMPDAKEGMLYALRAQYGGAGSWKTLGSPVYFIMPFTGIDGIISDIDDREVEYYDLQGMPVSDPRPGRILIRRVGSKVEKVIL